MTINYAAYQLEKRFFMNKESYNTNPVIILVAPQMGENIGSAARAMKNFNLTELRLVAPRDGWPNEKAEAMAVMAVDIVKKAKIYDSLEKAIADLEYLYATTSIPRSMNKNYVLSQDLLKDYDPTVKTGIMFGRESRGLTNKEIALADKIITINTGDFNSLNIAQALVIICYELFDASPSSRIANRQKLASKLELSYFFEHLFTELEQRKFFRAPEKKIQMTQNIMNIFIRIDKLSNNEVQTLRGIINTLTTTEK